jgi:hypothetical protein
MATQLGIFDLKLGEETKTLGLIELLQAIQDEPDGEVVKALEIAFPEVYASLVGAGTARGKVVGSEKKQAGTLATTQTTADSTTVQNAIKVLFPKLGYRNALGKVHFSGDIILSTVSGVGKGTLDLANWQYKPVGISGSGETPTAKLFGGDRFETFTLNGATSAPIKVNDFGHFKVANSKGEKVTAKVGAKDSEGELVCTELVTGKALLMVLGVNVRKSSTTTTEGTATPKIIKLAKEVMDTVGVKDSGGNEISLSAYLKLYNS